MTEKTLGQIAYTARIKELEENTISWRLINDAAKDGGDILALCDGDGTQEIPLVLCFDDKAEKPDWPWATLDGPNYHKDFPKWWVPIPASPRENKREKK